MGKVTRYKIEVDGFTYQVSVEDESGGVAAVSKEAPAAAPRQSVPEAPKAARPQKRERPDPDPGSRQRILILGFL